MVRQLPPLNALRAFEAAARHLSFTKAAAELGVTATAVTHHVNKLEDHLGVRLFHRSSRGLVLTEAGVQCLDGFAEGLDRLMVTTERAKNAAPDRMLRINVIPCFAAIWLSKNIGDFIARHPDINVGINGVRQTGRALLDADVTIRYVPVPHPGYHVERLVPEQVFPVCSPRLVRARRDLASAELAHYPLLHDESLMQVDTFPTWRAWFDVFGVKGADVSKGLRANVTELILQRAIEGHGIALGRSVLVQDHLAEGSLVRPGGEVYPISFAYHLIWRNQSHEKAKVSAFIDWILSRFADSQVVFGG